MLSVDTAKHLAGLLARRGINSIAVRTGADEDKSHLDGAFEILRHQRPDSWDDVIQQLNLLKGHSSARLIRRFNERLLHHLLLGDPETLAGTPRQRARIACYRDLMIASLLLAAGHTKSAAHIAQQTITRATQWEIAAAEIQALRFLRRRYATRGDKQETKSIERKIRLTEKIVAAEDEAEAIEDNCRIAIHSASKNLGTFNSTCLQQISRLRLLLLKHDRISIRTAYWRVSIWHGQIMNHHATVMKVANDASKWLGDHERFSTAGLLSEFDAARMSACLQLRDFNNAAKAWHQYSSRTRIGTVNWANVLQLYFLTCIVTTRYHDAVEAYLLYSRNIPTSLEPWRKQLWNVYGAYIAFIIDHGTVPISTEPEFTQRIYPGNIEKASVELVRDKHGANVSILVLKILHWIRSKKYSEIIENTEALRTYSSRYLRIPSMKRSAYFLKTLQVLPTADFEPDVWLKRTAKIKEYLTSHHEMVVDDAEIIPYSTLYDIVFDMLTSNSGRNRRRR